MIAFVIRHLLESTLFCVLLSGLACCLRRGASARYAVRLIAISKFAIPSLLLASTGARIAVFWPATSWFSSLTQTVSAAFVAILGMFPSALGNENPVIVGGILMIWAVGTAAMFSVWFVRLRNSQYRPILPSAQEQESLDRTKAVLRIRIPVNLRVSDALAGPALRGIFRPTVIIPIGLSQKLTNEEFQAVLLHELAHAQRFDNLTGAFVHCLICVFWFHPLLWVIEKWLDIEREHACDEVVIASGTFPRIYAAGIVKVCKFHLFEGVSGVSAMRGSGIKRRLESILECDSSMPRSNAPKLLIAALALLMTMVPIAGGYCQQCVSSGQALAPRHTGPLSDLCPSSKSKRLNHSCLE